VHQAISRHPEALVAQRRASKDAAQVPIKIGFPISRAGFWGLPSGKRPDAIAWRFSAERL